MERKTAIFFLNDGKEYAFSERNREDINFTELQNKYRAFKVKQIYKLMSELGNEELRDALILEEWRKQYSPQEVMVFVNDDADERLKLAFASFRIANPEINIETFKTLIDESILSKILKGIDLIEQDDPALDTEVCKELKLDKKLFIKWKKDHPEVYYAIKKALKKKVDQKSVMM